MAIPRSAVFVVVVIAALAFDQGTKAWARGLPTQPAHCDTGELAAQRCRGLPQPVIDGVWEWELAMNDGVAFSSFRGKRVALSIIAAVGLVIIGLAAARTKPHERIKRAGLALMFAGALGNLLDRVVSGSVTDFIRLRFGDHGYPIFNIADVALGVGVGLVVLDGLLAGRARNRPIDTGEGRIAA